MRPNSSALVGQTIDGYVILKEIGGGATSVVYQAMEPQADNRLLALKVLDQAERDLAGGVHAANPFRRELRIARQFQDPGILRIFRAGELHDGRFYQAMEFVAGMSLAEELRHRETIPWREACEIAEALSWSVAPLHEVGVVHRDVTPRNVMVRLGKDKRIHTKLIDFGTAKLPGEWDDDLACPMGTPQYMAPEQADGRGASVTSDVYAMGALLYEMLTGYSVLGRSRPTAESCSAYLEGDAPIPAQLLSDTAAEVPAPLQAFVHRALSRDPGQRPTDAFAFAHELGDAFDASVSSEEKGGLGWVRRLFGDRST
jgi:eukaryotic-like serine/threonine-protein kinase